MYKVISLFSGVGGSSLGYEMAGLKVLASVEFINYQAHNYRLNHPETRVYEEDIRKLDPAKIMQDLDIKEGELDILDGSPPCSSFSMAGKREKGWGKVKQYSNRQQRTDDLFFEYIRFLRVIKPRVFVAENVKGLTIGVAKGFFLEILKELKASGYNVKAKVMNAKYYGVPQSRERTIFIGVRNDIGIEPSYPVPSRKLITVRNAWIDVLEGDKIFCSNYSIGKLWEETKIGTSHSKRFSLHRVSVNTLCPTITQTMGNDSGNVKYAGNLMHPYECRYLTIPELKRIASFPDDFILEGTFAQQWEACGRAVPPLMMKAIAENIRINILDKHYEQYAGQVAEKLV